MLSLVIIWTLFFPLKGQNFDGIPRQLSKDIKTSILMKNPMIIAKTFIGAPYKSNQLSISNPEKVYYSFRDFDCITFVENVIALYNSDGMNDNFKMNLINYRYNDTISFESRNHYLSLGLEKLIHLKLIYPINNQINSKSIRKNLSYLSNHIGNKGIDKSKIIALENTLGNKVFYYFDSTLFVKINHLLKNGDIIAFLSSRHDLDFKHVGFVYIENNKKYVLHASQEQKQVCISNLTIQEYVKKHKSYLGFQIFRPII